MSMSLPNTIQFARERSDGADALERTWRVIECIHFDEQICSAMLFQYEIHEG